MSSQERVFQLADDWTQVTNPALRKKLQNKVNQRALRARKRHQRQTAQALESKRRDVQRYAVILPRPHNTVKAPQEQLSTSTLLSATVETMARFQAEARKRYYAADPCLDHLFTLSKFNVLRAFMDNMYALGLTVDTMDDDALSPFSTSMPGRHATNLVPPSLLPTTVQCSIPHHPWVDCFPFPQMRDNLIMAAESFDDCELCVDLVDPTSGDVGVMVWGDPWLPQNWEFSDLFVRRWSWVIQGCPEILVYSNYWRTRRGLKEVKFSSV